MKKVLVISSSLRKNSNSEQLAVSLAEGAKSAGNEGEVISLRDKEIKFCIGCLASEWQKIQKYLSNFILYFSLFFEVGTDQRTISAS